MKSKILCFTGALLALVSFSAAETAFAFKVGGFNWPSLDSTAGSLLKTDGSGNLGWTVPTSIYSFSSPLSLSGSTVSVPPAASGQAGYLTASDWATFSGKQNALTIGNLTSSTTGVSVSGGTGSVIGSGASISVQNATSGQPGLLTAADWNTFNGKQAAGNYLTALTGDVTATGPGSAGSTVITVGASTAANIHAAEIASNAATNANTPSTIVKRDASGNFTAGTITGALTGNASTATTAGNVTGTVAIGNGGTGQTTQQTALNALTGTQSSGKYLRSDGTNSGLATIVAGDVPTLNQNTTGTASNVTGTVAIANGGTGQTGKTAAFNALSPNTTKGDVAVYDGSNNVRFPLGSTGQILTADTTTTTGWKWAANAGGGGGSGKNYITNGDFETNATTGFSLFSTTIDATTKNPTGAISAGASGLTTFATTGSSPLAGSYSLSLGNATSGVTIGTTAQGVISDAFTIDRQDRAKVLAFKFSYEVTAGSPVMAGNSTNTFAVYIFDSTAGTWIQPSGVYGMTQGSGQGVASGTFQTTSSSTQYQIAVLMINTTSAATLINLDSIQVGPQSVVYGPAMSDWTAYTPVVSGYGTGGAAAGYPKGFYRRVGSAMEVQILVQKDASAGTGTSPMYFGLPSGYSIDTTKLADGGSSQTQSLGGAATYGVSTAAQYDREWSAVYGTATQLSLGKGGASHTMQGGEFLASGTVGIYATVPILGWSSNTQMSADSDQRIISSTYQSVDGKTVLSNGIFKYESKISDRTGSYDPSTGIYTVGQAGTYKVTASARSSAAVTPADTVERVWQIDVYKGGIFYERLAYNNTIGSTNARVVALRGTSSNIECVAGDTLQINQFQNYTVAGTATTTTAGYNVLTIEKIANPAAIQATETLNARYGTTAGQSIATGSPVLINFDTKDYDSHGSVTTGASWKFSPQVSGTFSVTGLLTGTNPAWTAGQKISVDIYKNGVQEKRLNIRRFDTAVTNFWDLPLNGDLKLNAGEYADIRVTTDVSTSLNTTANLTWVAFKRTGN